jgi:hypothetical protein
MFCDSSTCIEEYTTSVTGYMPTVTVCTYPRQKPWITGNIHTALKARAASFKERDTNPDTYMKSCYALRLTIKQAKCHALTVEILLILYLVRSGCD